MEAQTVGRGTVFVCRPTQPNLRSDSNHRPVTLVAGALPAFLPLKRPADGGQTTSQMARWAGHLGNPGSYVIVRLGRYRQSFTNLPDQGRPVALTDIADAAEPVARPIGEGFGRLYQFPR